MAAEGYVSRNTLRDNDIYEKRINGASTDELAAEYGLSTSMISVIVRNVARKLPEQDRSRLTAFTMETLMDLRAKVMEMYSLRAGPVTVGKDGIVLRDPETGEVVRDHSMHLRAIETALRIDAQFSKRLGLDAPTQTESVVKASVQYEIVGVDPEDLT